MDIAFVSVIRFSGEHAPSNEMLKKWAKKTWNEINSMRNRVVDPIILTSLLLVVVLMKKIVQEFRKSGRSRRQRRAPHTGGRKRIERVYIVYDR